MGTFSIWHGLIVLIVTSPFWFLPMIPISEIIRKAGYSRWWALVYLVPFINLIALFVFAFSRWPMLDRAATLNPRRDETPIPVSLDRL